MFDLIHLDVSNNPITGSIPASIGDFLALESLRINSTGITGSIPYHICEKESLGAGLTIDRDADVSCSEAGSFVPSFTTCFQGMCLFESGSQQVTTLEVQSLTGAVRTAQITAELVQPFGAGSPITLDNATVRVDDNGQWMVSFDTNTPGNMLVPGETYIVRVGQSLYPDGAGGYLLESSLAEREFTFPNITEPSASVNVEFGETSFDESAEDAELLLTIPGGVSEIVDILVTAQDGTALSGEDYSIFQPGRTDLTRRLNPTSEDIRLNIPFNIISDEKYEGTEVFQLSVFRIEQGVPSLLASAQIEIRDMLRIGFTENIISVDEGNNRIEITVSIVEEWSSLDRNPVNLSLNVEGISGIRNAAANDFLPLPITGILLDPSVNSQVITLDILDDETIEFDEIIGLRLATDDPRVSLIPATSRVRINASDNIPHRNDPFCLSENLLQNLNLQVGQPWTVPDLSICYEDTAGNRVTTFDVKSGSNYTASIDGTTLTFIPEVPATPEAPISLTIAVTSFNGETILDVIRFPSIIDISFAEDVCDFARNNSTDRVRFDPDECRVLERFFSDFGGGLDRWGSVYVDEWLGVETTVEADGFAHITELRLPNRNLSNTTTEGVSRLGELSYLRILDLSDNPNISGLIESSLWGLGRLEELYLSNAGLDGAIRNNLRQSVNLRILDVSNNDRLTGNIGRAIEPLLALRDPSDLRDTALVGLIPFHIDYQFTSTTTTGAPVTYSDLEVAALSTLVPNWRPAQTFVSRGSILSGDVAIEGTSGAVPGATVNLSISASGSPVIFASTVVGNDNSWRIDLPNGLNLVRGTDYTFSVSQHLYQDEDDELNTLSSTAPPQTIPYPIEESTIEISQNILEQIDEAAGIVEFSVNIATSDDALFAPNTRFISWEVIDGTALQGEDYSIEATPSGNGEAVASGESRINISLSILNDDIVEGDETFTLVLFDTDTSGGTPIVRARTVEVTIRDNDFIVVGFDMEDYTASETDDLELTIRAPQGIPPEAGDITLQVYTDTAPGTDQASPGNRLYTS